MSTNRKPLEFKAAKTKFRPRERRQNDFLFYLADGQSIEQACNLLGITRAAYEKWRVRHEGFKEAVEAARESHRRDIACGLHGADAYARMLLDAIQRDESLPAPLRYRASKTILTRKGKTDWLPDPILASTEPLAPYDDEQPESLFVDPDGNDALSSNGHIYPNPAKSHPQWTVSESANGATASCGQGLSESASAARGNAPCNLPTPKAAAELVPPQPPGQSSQSPDEPQGSPFSTPEAGSRKPEAVRAPASTPHPDNPDKPTAAHPAANSMKNQQDPPATTVSRNTPEFFGNPDSQASAPQASAANLTPEAGSQKPEAVLSQQWLSNHFLHGHESKQAFEKLLANHIGAYQPATAPEELLVFRITQKSWLLRRVETWERVIADSRVAKIREKHPNAAAPACIAMSLLEVKESNQTRFYERAAKLRKQHEDAQDRLESKLFTIQQRSEATSLRAQRRSLPTVRVPAQGGLPDIPGHWLPKSVAG